MYGFDNVVSEKESIPLQENGKQVPQKEMTDATSILNEADKFDAFSPKTLKRKDTPPEERVGSTIKRHDTSEDTDPENEDQNILWRRGKWTVEEERYADKLIDAFQTGHIILSEGDGRTLRSYLAKKLNCNPMRISKKYAGLDGLGARFQRSLTNDIAQIDVFQKEIVNLERVFRIKDAEVQQRRQRRRWRALKRRSISDDIANSASGSSVESDAGSNAAFEADDDVRAQLEGEDMRAQEDDEDGDGMDGFLPTTPNRNNSVRRFPSDDSQTMREFDEFLREVDFALNCDEEERDVTIVSLPTPPSTSSSTLPIETIFKFP